MKILITGVNGFIGNSICKHFDNSPNYQVYGLGRGNYKHASNIKYIECDISDINQIEQLKKNIDEIDIIVHCAACIDKNDFNPELINVNCNGTQNILNLAIEIGVKKLIYISGMTVIGSPLSIPIDELHPVMPNKVYHASKLMGENIALIGINYGIEAVSLRIPSPIGFGMNLNSILSIFIKKCIENTEIELLGNGERIQNYIDVKDICSAVHLCLDKNVNGIFNIASNESYSNKELANICKDTLNSKSKIIFNGDHDPEENNKWIISIEKAKKILGFNPICRIEDTILDIAKELMV